MSLARLLVFPRLSPIGKLATCSGQSARGAIETIGARAATV
jgi:hypothetical protein